MLPICEHAAGPFLNRGFSGCKTIMATSRVQDNSAQRLLNPCKSWIKTTRSSSKDNSAQYFWFGLVSFDGAFLN